MSWKHLLAVVFLTLGAHAATLEISGDVETPLHVDAALFETLPRTTLENVALICRSGAVKAPPARYEGVLLADLIGRVAPRGEGRGVRNRCVVLAVGSDGYAAAFSYHELTNTAVGPGVLVVREGEGYALYSREDRVGGPRHIRDLAALQVRVLEPKTGR